jgi:2-haloacid dehalogenase
MVSGILARTITLDPIYSQIAMLATTPAAVRALTFDVFGTVVDWRTSIAREGEALGRARGITHVDWMAFADAWRGLYQPALARVRKGERPWTKLDDLHRESLERLLAEFKISGLRDDEIDHLNRAWHRLSPWPDAVDGLTRLRRRFVLATLSNGNVALIVNMARHAGLPWDAVLGAEVARHYKPEREAYLTTAALLGVRPEECMMVAAHNGDLVAASACGFRTAFVARPTEYGPGQQTDLRAEHAFDVVAADFVDLAAKLGA